MRRSDPPPAVPVAGAVAGFLLLTGCSFFSPALLPARPVDASAFPVVEAAKPSVAKVSGTTCSGAAVVGSAFVAGDHLVLTAAHVVTGARTLALTFPGSADVPAELVGIDPDDDTALLRTRDELPPVLPLAPSALPLDEPVAVIGYPIPEPTLRTTFAHVTGLDEKVVIDGHQLAGLLVVDAQVQPGTSGGPVMDAAGHVLGMTSAQIAGRGGRDSSTVVTLAVPAVRLAGRLPEWGDKAAPTPCS